MCCPYTRSAKSAAEAIPASRRRNRSFMRVSMSPPMLCMQSQASSRADKPRCVSGAGTPPPKRRFVDVGFPLAVRRKRDKAEMTFASLGDSALVITISDEIQAIWTSRKRMRWLIRWSKTRRRAPGMWLRRPRRSPFFTIRVGSIRSMYSVSKVEERMVHPDPSVPVVARWKFRSVTAECSDLTWTTSLFAPDSVLRRSSNCTPAPDVVRAIGFAPGFAYLGGLPTKLHTPRLATPRTQVSAGGVGIGGAQTGVYPVQSPGGWNIVGRTPLKMFDPCRQEPAVLKPGDRVDTAIG